MRPGTCTAGWTPEPGEYCPVHQRNIDILCGKDPHAPWCGGPSMKECADGTEVPEDQTCEAPLPAPPPDTLPATGIDPVLLIGAVIVAALGILLVRIAQYP